MTTAERDEAAWIIAALRSYRDSTLPPGFADNLPSYEELMAQIATMSEEERARVTALLDEMEGTVMEEMGWGVFSGAVHRQRLQEQVGEGLAAMVEMYYENYTDATCLEPEVLRGMAMLSEECMAGIDIEDLVSEVERKLNEAGGVEGSDGVRHTVRTFEEKE